jgi:glycosyltransferase involved in cell wall biosynthesis
VAFKRGSAPEVLAHGVTGFVVETTDEFVDAVKHISEINPQRCRERVENMFTAQAMVDDYERVYMKVLGGE